MGKRNFNYFISFFHSHSAYKGVGGMRSSGCFVCRDVADESVKVGLAGMFLFGGCLLRKGEREWEK